MTENFSGNFFDKLLDLFEVEFKIPLGIAEIALKVSDPAKRWWKSKKARSQLKRVIQAAEYQFRADHPSDRVAQLLYSFPLYADNDFQKVITGLLTNLDEEKITWLTKIKLEHDWGNLFGEKEIHDALAGYLPYLRHELSKISEFREVVSALRLERIDNTVEDTNKFVRQIEQRTRKIEQLLSPIYVTRPTFYVPFPRNEKFVGRDDDLERLHTALQCGDTVGVRPAMLSGMGGIGKTQLAIEYAYRYQKEYPGGVYWINAAEDWLAEIAGLTERLNLHIGEISESQRLTRLAQTFFIFLADYPDALLIFDNVEDPRTLRLPIASFIPSELPCSVLFTTRRREFDLPFESIVVHVLPKDAALELLLNSNARKRWLTELNTQDHPELDAAYSICHMLGYLPLALALASAFLGKHPNIPLDAYRKRLENEGLEAIDDSGVDPIDLPTRHNAAVAATLATQWNTLKDDNAHIVIQAAALLEEGALIPRARLSLLTGLSDQAEAGYPSPLDESLHMLQTICLVEELGPEYIRLHPLVRDFVNRVTPDTDRFTNTCVHQLTKALWNISRLDQEITRRGIDPVLADIRSILTFSATTSDTTMTNLISLLEPLDREAHHLRKSFGHEYPGYILQQIHNRALNLNSETLQKQLHLYLGRMGLAWFEECFPTNSESQALLRTFEGHTGGVNSVVLTADGKRALSASDDGTLRLWDLESGQSLRTFEGHSFLVDSVVLAADGRHAISASRDYTLRLWDLDSGQSLRTFEGHSSIVYSVVLTADGKRAISASDDGTLRLWDLESGLSLRTFEGHTDGVNSVVLTADGKRALSASDDGALRLWDLESGQSLRTFEGHTSLVRTVVLTADGKRALSASDDGALRLWDLESGQSLRTFKVHNSFERNVVLTADGKRALSASWDGNLHLWDLESGQSLCTFEGHTDEVHSVALTADGKRALSASRDKTLRLWDLDSGQSLRTFEGHTDEVNCVVLTADRKRAISASRDYTLRLWDLESGQPLHAFEGHTDEVHSIVIAVDGRHAISASWDKTLRLWDLESGQSLRTFEGHTSFVNSVVLTADGKRALSASTDNTLRLWDLESGQSLRTFEGHTSFVNSMVLTADGKRALSASWDKTLRLWDLYSGQSLCTFEGHTGGVNSVVLTADGKRALSASKDNTLRLWDLESGQSLRTFEGHTDGVNSVVLTADGKRALSASDDVTLCLWDLESSQSLCTFEGHTSFVNSVVLTADGKRALSASTDNTLHLWDLESGQSLRTFEGHTSFVNSVVLTADGRRAISASNDGTLRLWDLESGQSLLILVGNVLFTSIALDQPHQLVVVGDTQGGVHIIKIHNLPLG